MVVSHQAAAAALWSQFGGAPLELGGKGTDSSPLGETENGPENYSSFSGPAGSLRGLGSAAWWLRAWPLQRSRPAPTA